MPLFNKLLLAVLALVLLPLVTSAQSAFPVDTAGIAAYANLGPLAETNFTNAERDYFDKPYALGDTFRIGLKDYCADDFCDQKVTFRVYISTSGWLVVYLPKEEPVSKIFNWRTGSTLENNLLKIAIDDAASKIGSAITSPMNYYDFSHSQATKMTFAREWIKTDDGQDFDDFDILIPGTLHLASYSLACLGGCGVYPGSTAVKVSIDDNLAAGEENKLFVWGNYDPALLATNASHNIKVERRPNSKNLVSAATLILYTP